MPLHLDSKGFDAALTTFSQTSGGTEEKLAAAIRRYLAATKEEPTEGQSPTPKHEFRVGE